MIGVNNKMATGIIQWLDVPSTKEIGNGVVDGTRDVDGRRVAVAVLAVIVIPVSWTTTVTVGVTANVSVGVIGINNC
jgi:hypothetical protein